ncbi:MAG TPA: hypothetical protein VFZ65_19720 [Planctomycetota bacterium]|nr:hypothetical protein [Planctomycetota bacterium]
MQNPYLALTDAFNRGALRTLLSSGQAVVMHRLAVMSKDGDWILREDPAAVEHVLEVLAAHGARYRFGAPLDLRWLAGGWSAHLEFPQNGLRIRTDFVSRPPRISRDELQAMWSAATDTGDPVVGLVPLAAIKLTNREKDYAVVGELARAMPDPSDQIRFSRSALDLLDLARQHPELVAAIAADRPALASIGKGRDAIEAALDHERRTLMRNNEQRLQAYRRASEAWATIWTDLQREIGTLPLHEAHAKMVQRALGVLPFRPPEIAP